MRAGRRRWQVRVTGDVRRWLQELRRRDPETYERVRVAVDMLAETGPGLGRPLVDTLRGSNISNLKELRPRSGREVAIRVLFVFDPWSQAVLLVAGNKSQNWTRWYQENIPLAEVAYKAWLDNERERRGEL
ncbi:type II toxin-antitoxin system RelE/ParE family toxin [Micromonospora sp. CA-263727]|uniref:type II toxin-antitoxin system RelE/ParE family toxin n=1 Tax=Micromonospora sp. CA-263727 TaxID=3239967 RepID=UPI003D92E129